MKIICNRMPPRWCRNAVPTPKGWADPKTGKLLISCPLQVMYVNDVPKTPVKPVVEEQPKTDVVEEVKVEPEVKPDPVKVEETKPVVEEKPKVVVRRPRRAKKVTQTENE